MKRQHLGGPTVRERLLLDPQWRFHSGDIPFQELKGVMDSYSHGWAKSGAFQGAADPGFDDSGWRVLDLPHDWVVEGTFAPEAALSHGYLPTGVAWYRKTFRLPAADVGRRLHLEFEGVFRDATVYLNGHRLGHEPSGYISYFYDITDQALYGDDNVLAVRVDARESEGWWYEGGGIYRHVWLTKTSPLHIKPWGVFVSAAVQRGGGRAALRIQTEVTNADDSEVRGEIRSAVIAPDGRTVADIRSRFSAPAGETVETVQRASLRAPALWSVDTPSLYRLRTTVLLGRKLVDQVETPFGVRTLRFDARQGFFLNGKPVKLKGASNHQDHAGVGIALPDRLYEYRVRRLQDMGANAWRCAHHPPAPAFLEACDRLGMLVMDETRCMNSTADGLRQLDSMVRRDRNHPCVVFWSLGNEEFLQGSPMGERIIRTMKRRVRRLDPTRPVTLAMNGCWGEPVSPLLDVQGCNYSAAQYDDYHRKFPKHPMVGSETSAAISTRGEYVNDRVRGYYSAYDVNSPGFGGSAETSWRVVADRAFVAGTFPWTGFDYRGEPSPASWPCVSSQFGILDTCGFPKDTFYYYQSWWSDRVVLHVFPHWTWPGREGEEIGVWCFSNCDAVELFLNGASLGRKEMPLHGHLEWKVKYVPGTLSARGYRGAHKVAEQAMETAGAPARIVLTPDRHALQADGEDTAAIAVAVVDAKGHVVPDADNEIRFDVSGQARFLGAGNGNPASHEPDKVPRRRAFHGLCQVLIQAGRASGAIELQACSNGLVAARLEIRAEGCRPRPSLAAVDPTRRIDLARAGSARTTPLKGKGPAGWTEVSYGEAGWQPVDLNTALSLPSPSLIRVRFTVPEGMGRGGLEADLEQIHDFDETWLNGVRLGSVTPRNTPLDEAWRTRRRYRIPERLLRAGQENVLAIRAWNRRTDANARTALPGPLRIRPTTE